MATAKKAAKKPAAKKSAAKKPAAKKPAAKKPAAKKAAPKKAAPKKKPAAKKPAAKRKPNAAFMKPLSPSAMLALVVGSSPLPRTGPECQSGDTPGSNPPTWPMRVRAA